MPSWSSPRPSSRVEQSMPFDQTPAILRRPISMPLGITVPMVASGTRSPAAMLKAPQPISSGWPSPASTMTWWILLAPSIGARLEHLGDDDAVEPLADPLQLLDRHAEVAHLLAERDGVALERGEVAQPGEEDLHRWCLELGEEADVVGEEVAEVVDAVGAGAEAVEAEAEGEALPLLGVDAAAGEHVRVDHAAAAELEPRAVGPLDVELGRRLGEREVRRAAAAR